MEILPGLDGQNLLIGAYQGPNAVTDLLLVQKKLLKGDNAALPTYECGY